MSLILRRLSDSASGVWSACRAATQAAEKKTSRIVRLWRRQRVTLGVRLLLVLCTIAGFAIALALLLQGRSLLLDLREAAHTRLEVASASVDQLIEEHLETLASRYGVLTGTPQFLANLEAGHSQTLDYFAKRLAKRERADVVLFLDRRDAALAVAGDTDLAALARRRFLEKATGTSNGKGDGSQQRDLHTAVRLLISQNRTPYTLVGLPMVLTGGEPLGQLIVLEKISRARLASWSKLCGTRVTIGEEPSPEEESLIVRPAGSVDVRVSGTFDAEREALANSRRNLLLAGVAAMLLALAASVVVTKSLIVPFRVIQAAAESIGNGDLGFRLDDSRRDEVGDVARAFNVMLKRLDATQSRLSNAQRLAKLGSWGLDMDEGMMRGSREFRNILGIAGERVEVPLGSFLSLVHEDDRRALRAGIERCACEGKFLRMDHRTIPIDGLERIIHTQAERVAPGQIEGTAQDITDRKRIEDQVRYLAYRDSLTGLGNRRMLKESLAVALERAQRTKCMVAVLFLDLDRFKVINDTLGHSVGDELLIQVAERLVRNVSLTTGGSGSEGADPYEAALVTRLGGDEFTVLLTEAKDRKEVESFAEAILSSFSEPFYPKDEEVAVTPSIGIALSPDDSDDIETLLRNSDTAMYHAKSSGSRSYAFYSDWMQVAAHQKLVLENRLRHALDNQEFELLYQPKVDMVTNEILGVEALLRLRDPDFGLVAPDDFIPLAEETGAILPIGEWVFREAVRQAKEWTDAGLPPLRMAVNISVYQIEDPNRFLAFLADVLETTGFDPRFLDLEITESSLMRDENEVIDLLWQLRNLGIGLSLDDFGTGFSSLSYLRRLPIDALKIDRSFVRRIDKDADDAAFAEAIVGMARVLRLRVVVEGVETEEQRRLLQSLGCDEYQGFLHSTPVKPATVAEMIQAQPAGPVPEADCVTATATAGASAGASAAPEVDSAV